MIVRMRKISIRRLCAKVPDYTGMSIPLIRNTRECRRILRRTLGPEQRREIVTAYLRVLNRMSGSIAVESDLPCSKRLIRLAIVQELVESPNTEMRSQLEIAYAQLESFVSREEYWVMADFRDASLHAEAMADTGDPTRIIDSVKIMRKARGDRAVTIQERISARMRQRLARIRELGATALGREGVPPNAWRACV
ncbi:MAG: hypothetical protein WAW37_19645 [Syntrophobacteraceae bacterium]